MKQRKDQACEKPHQILPEFNKHHGTLTGSSNGFFFFMRKCRKLRMQEQPQKVLAHANLRLPLLGLGNGSGMLGLLINQTG